MERNMVLCGLVVLCVIFAEAPDARAQWVQNGVPLISSAIPEEEIGGVRCSIRPDGEGGLIFAWPQELPGTGVCVFAQRMDASGRLLWGSGGIQLSATASERCSQAIAPGGDGSAIVFWTDTRGCCAGVYAQRIDGEGHLLWAANGVPIPAGGPSRTFAGATAGEANGAIIAWVDSLDAYVLQKIDSDARPLWPDSGVVVASTGHRQSSLSIVPDGAGGVIVGWCDFVDEPNAPAELRMQRIDSRGTRRWPEWWPEPENSPGIVIVHEFQRFMEFWLVADEAGGAFLAWQDNRNGNPDVYAQHIASIGFPDWADGGVPICTQPDYQYGPRIVLDGSGGAIVAFGTLSSSPGTTKARAQRIDATGNTLWATNGIALGDPLRNQQVPAIVSDGSGGAIVAWSDYAAGGPETADIFSQRITGEGEVLWPSAGIPVCTVTGKQVSGQCLPDGEGGAVVLWSDPRSGTWAIYAQRIDRDGYWGYPAPSIEAVRDVPGDQGGFVNLAWLASRLDPWPGNAISSYSVWRSISPRQAALALKNGGAMLSNLADFGSRTGKPLIRVENTGSRTFYWKLVSTVSASHLDGYSEIVPTLFDSTAVCGEYHYFQVIAHGNDPGMYWISAPDSGRSIDNLAPAPPAGLAGTPGSNAEGLNLTWHRGSETDFGHYAVYRGSIEGFEPAPGNRIAALADTMYLDADWRARSRCYYKVAAVDIHGNESCCSLLRPEDIAGGETRKTPAANFLAQNYPNPFNPSTKIVFGLREPEFVSLKVFDAAGRLVRVLVEADRTAGVHEAFWDGRDDRGAQMSSGLYFCRLKAGSFTSLRKMVLLK
jgi:hypothetical protein